MFRDLQLIFGPAPIFLASAFVLGPCACPWDVDLLLRLILGSVRLPRVSAGAA